MNRPADTQSPQETSPEAIRPKRRRLRRALIALALAAAVLVVLVLLAPSILSLGVCRGLVVDQVNSRVPVRLAVKDLSLSWFGRQEVSGLTVETAQGKRVAAVGQASLDQGLWNLVTDGTRLGAVYAKDLDVWTDGVAQLRESLAAQAPEPKPPKAPAAEGPPLLPEAVTLESVKVHTRIDVVSLRRADFRKDPDTGHLHRLEAAWALQNSQGTLRADVEGLRTDWRGWETLGVAGTLRCERLPLTVVLALAADLGVPIKGGGTISAEATVTRTRAGDVAVKAACAGQDLWATGDLLNGDRPALASLNLIVAGEYAGGVCRVDDFMFESPVASAQARGTFALPSAASAPPTGSGTARVSADLAAVARMLPNTLNIHKDLVVQAGSLEAALDMASDGKTDSLRMKADLKDLGGVRAGKPIALGPVHLAADVARDRPDAPPPSAGRPPEGAGPAAAPDDPLAALRAINVKALSLSGPFGTLEARGRIEAFTLDAKIDLTKTTQEVGQFIDLAGRAAAGAAIAHVKTQGDFAKGVQLDLRTELTDLVLDLGEGRRLREPHATLAAAGTLTFDAQQRLTGAEVSDLAYTGSPGAIRAKADARATPAGWTVRAAANGAGDAGELARCTSELLGRPASRMSGQWNLESTGEALLATGRTQVSGKATARATDLVVEVGAEGKKPTATRIADATIEADARLDLASSLRAEIAKLRVAAPGLAADVQGTAILPADGAVTGLQGQGDVRASVDLARLADLLRPFGFLPADAQLAGTVNLTASAAEAQAGRQPMTLAADARALAVQWPGGLRVNEERLTVSAEAAVVRDAAGALAQVQVGRWSLDAPAGQLSGTAALTPAGNAWTYQLTASGGGQVEPLSRTVAGLLGREPTAIRGRWQVEGQFADAGPAGRSADAVLSATDLVIPRAVAARPQTAARNPADQPPPADVRLADVRLADVRLDADATLFPDGRVQLRRADFAGPGLAVKAAGAAVLPADGAVTGLHVQGDVRASVDLARLADLLRPFGLLPADAQLAGTVNLTASAAEAQAGRQPMTLAADARALAVQWPGGLRVNEERLTVSAEGAVVRDAAGALAQVQVGRWSLDAPAGQLAGTAALKPAANNDAWAYQVSVSGEGDAAPLSRTVAGLLGREPTPLRGRWQVKGQFADAGPAGRSVDAVVSATDLVIPRAVAAKAEAAGQNPAVAPPPADLRLADVRLDADATLFPDGRVEVRRADLAGPGLAVKAAGTARLPAGEQEAVTADGSFSLKADLAQVADLLRPFGILAPDARLAGAASADGKVATRADGLSGAATVDLKDLDVQLPQSGIALAEPQVHLPLTLAYTARDRRWSAAVVDLKSALASGNLTGAFVPGATPTAPAAVQVDCDLACDGARLGGLLAKQLPKDLALAGPWRIKARAAGPLADAKTWNQQIVGLAGDGVLEVGRFQYRRLTGGNGPVAWRLADGQMLLNSDPQRPSRLAVAGGAVNLGGRIDLRGPTARLVLTEPLRMIENVSLEGEEVVAFLKYTSPVLAASMNPRGRLQMTVDALDLPLTADALKQGTARGQFQIDDFQADLTGPLGMLFVWSGGQTRTPQQPFGPVRVQLEGGVFRIQPHDLLIQQNTAMRFGGTIGVDGAMDIAVGVPLTEAFLAHHGVSKSVLPYLQGQVITVPLTGTVDKPRLDDKALAKQIGQMVLEALRRRAIQGLGDFLRGGGLEKK